MPVVRLKLQLEHSEGHIPGKVAKNKNIFINVLFTGLTYFRKVIIKNRLTFSSD